MTLPEQDKWYSNEWLAPLGEKAGNVFSALSQADAVSSAAAILAREDTGNTDIPYTVIFPSDGIDAACESLLLILKTPDYRTPFYSATLQCTLTRLDTILSESGAFESPLMACHAAYHLVRVAAGKQDENFLTYTDNARRWPQYADTWKRDLTRQFSAEMVRDATRRHPELFQLLRLNALIAKSHTMSLEPLQQADEITPDFLTRVFDSLAITTGGNITEDSLRSVNAALSKRHVPYVRMAYALRGMAFQE